MENANGENTRGSGTRGGYRGSRGGDRGGGFRGDRGGRGGDSFRPGTGRGGPRGGRGGNASLSVVAMVTKDFKCNDEELVALRMGNLPKSSDFNRIKNLLKGFKQVDRSVIFGENVYGMPNGIGIVLLENSDEAQKALESLSGTQVDK